MLGGAERRSLDCKVDRSLFPAKICSFMNLIEEKEKPYGGCLILLWIVSPFVCLAIWGYVRLVNFFQWAINEDLRGRYEGNSPTFNHWATAWWETAWLVIIVGVVGFGILVPIYIWAIIVTVRRLKRRS
jgi:hypothetical protein